MRIIHRQKREWLAVHKPASYTVYREDRHDGTASGPNLLDELEALYEEKFYPVHRLDRGTCGIVVFAMHSPAQIRLQKAFALRTTVKIYEGIVVGQVEEDLQIKTPLERQSAETSVFPRRWTPEFSWLEIEPKTGRFHQIRKHLKGSGFPILGDPEYGRKKDNDFLFDEYGVQRTLLSAVYLQIDGVELKTNPDDDFLVVRKSLFPDKSGRKN